jgi:diguanylate cyclase (GGDEF)-like protein
MFTLEGYTVQELFQQSGQFSLYKGISNADKVPVVLKVCQSDRSAALSDIVALQHEYEISKQLNLSVVVHVYDLIKTQNSLVLVLEDIGGTSLQQYLSNGHVSITEFLKIAIQLVDAIGELHLQNIIHKDINPNNIWINPVNFTIKLADFGISSVLSQENQENRSLHNLQGSLSYFSPEQTGRMNRSVDYRSDFYSLGVTLYEMLAGKVPFDTKDTLELVHLHLTAEPESLTSTNPDIPLVIEDIIFKLLSKMPESRYKSAAGLRADILLCQELWEKNKSIERFPVGKSDLQDHLTISPKLYGREEQFDILLDKFNSVSKGHSELVFVSGYSGIGKTSLVKELYQPIAKQRGYYFSGKFDQLQRATPYSAMIEAFSGFVQYCLTEPESQLTHLRTLLKESLGNNGQIIINIIPSVELIIGKQPPLAELPTEMAQNRLTSTFLNFVRTVIQFKHPLVLFIDDLQWIDMASLNLIKLLVEDSELHELMIIGAYRDNEVSETHPLMIMQQQLAKNNIKFSNILLTPLKEINVEHLITDSLVATQNSIPEFANLVMNKTNGNPFFIYAFLKELYDEGLLKFSYQESAWTWDIDGINKLGITDNVVDLLIARLDKLPEKTREILKLAACIGHTFDLVTLSTVGEEGLSETAKHILEATKSSFVVPVNANYQLLEVIAAGNVDISQLSQGIKYRFIHDKIQQAAYELIPEEQKQQFHLKIGRLLSKGKIIEENSEELFDILNHFNAAISDISDVDERLKLAKLNLWAGKRAKLASAYQGAKLYINAGVLLLDGLNEADNCELQLELKKELANCQYLTGEYELAEKNFNQLLKECGPSSVIEVTRLYCQMLITLNRNSDALRLVFKTLAIFNIKIPDHPSKLRVLWEVVKIRLLIGRRNVAEIDLPLMQSTQYKQISALIAQAAAYAYVTDANLAFLLICIGVKLSLRYGYTNSTGSSLLPYAFMTMHGLNWYQHGLQICALYERLSKQYPQSSYYEVKNKYVLLNFINPWRFPLNELIDPFHQLSPLIFDVGDFAFCNICNYASFRTSMAAGKPISESQVYLQNMLSFIDKYEIKMFNVLSDFTNYFFQCLIKDDIFSVEKVKEYDNNVLTTKNNSEIAYFYFTAIKLCFLFGCYDDVNYYSNQFNIYITNIIGTISTAEGTLFSALSITAVFTANNKQAMKTLNKFRKKINRWAGWCPVNYLHYLLLVDAEIARLNKKTTIAIQYYTSAINAAKEAENNFIVAIAYELLARFYVELSSPDVARLYYQYAYDTYMLIGYTGKAKQVHDKYLASSTITGELITRNEGSDTESTSIDLLSLMKSSQAISSEIELDKLLNKLLVILLQNAGAHRVMLLAKDKKVWYVEAEGTASEQRISLSSIEPFDMRHDIPLSLIRQLQRTQESVLVQTPQEVDQHAEDDEYIKITKPQSMLVIPVFYHGELQSIIYLENLSVSMAFKSEHVRILQILSAQTAISLQNARLYYQATHDALTGVANRNLLYQVFEFSANKSKNTTHATMAIMLFDLDNFKKINDTLGHFIGDKVLLHISHLISTCIGKENLAARLGGDEFVAMVEYKDMKEITTIAEKFMQKLNQPVKIEGHELLLSSSVGISLFPHDAEDISDLLRLADMALYRVKAKGKKQFQLYTSSLQNQLKLDQAEETDLRHALEKGEFRVYYQPIYCAKGNNITSCEALLRWQHPEKGLISAKDFIPAAEKIGLIVPIGKYVIKTVLEQVNKWKAAGLNPVPIAINVSALQFNSEFASDLIQELNTNYKDHSHLLELELTESVLMKFPEKVLQDIEKLKQFGVRISLDDFGTYYSSLTYLRQGIFDKIKIDQTFTKGITSNERDRKLITAIISIAHSLNLKVVAEGVKNQDELDFLVSEEVDEVQGYYQSRPIPADECNDLFL